MYLSAIVSEYTSLGCWKDSSDDRAIPTMEGKCTHLDAPYQTRTNVFEKCMKCAREMGMKIFALQNGGWCAGTAIDGMEYMKYGVASTCKADGLGAHGASNVYKLYRVLSM